MQCHQLSISLILTLCPSPSNQMHGAKMIQIEKPPRDNQNLVGIIF